MIKYVFMDMGNVILNEDPLITFIFRNTYNHLKKYYLDSSFNDFLKELTELIEKNHSDPYFHLIKKYLPEEEYNKKNRIYDYNTLEIYEELNPLMPKVKELILELENDIKLGIIANQPKEGFELLEKYGLQDCFKDIFISEFVGYKKPDKKLFEYAVENAQVKAEECLMIGDRIDNDVIPAKSIGMKTLHLRLLPKEKEIELTNHVDRKDYELFLDYYKRSSVSLRRAQNDSEKPDYEANSIDELSNILKTIND